MTGEHPWREWLEVLGVFLAGLALVWIIVRALLHWAHKPDEKKGDDARPKGGSDTERK
jgi:hypothetical protein